MLGPLRDPLGRAVLGRALVLVVLVVIAARAGSPWGLAVGVAGALLLGVGIALRLAPLRERIQELAAEEGSGKPDVSLRGLAQSVDEARTRLAAERQRAERERDDVLGILEATSDGILVLGHHQRVEMINDAARRLLRPPLDPLGRSLPELVRVRDLLDYAEGLRRGEPLTPRTIQIPAPDRPDRQRVVSLSGALVRGDHPRSRAVLVLHDLTAVSRLESVRTDFVANVTHEMRSPLASILGYAETLATMDDLGSTEARDFLERILRNTHRLDDIIRDLIELSRLEHSRAPEVESTDVRSLVRDLAAGFADQVRDKGLTLSVDVDRLPPTLPVDGGLLRQALINLVDNAVKYTPSGGRVEVGGTMRHDQGTWLELFVRDTGPGIPLEHQGRVFERFYRVDTARSRSVGGTGLGLAIVKHAAALHGGQVDLESSEAGSAFRVLVPVAPG